MKQIGRFIRLFITTVRFVALLGLICALMPGSADVGRAQTPAAPLLSTYCVGVTEIPAAECEALVALYTATNGASWTNRTGWLQTKTPCSWYGVVCSSGHVTELRLQGNSLTGTIPPELGDLSSLQIIHLHNNQLTGSIPSSLGSLSALEEIGFDGNDLSGGIPPELGDLSNLRWLHLFDNQLIGSIPSQLGNLTSLENLLLFDNQLTGSIPSQLGNLNNLLILALQDNQLSGSIPPELGDLSSLQIMHLHNNQLTESIPSSLGSLSALEEIGLDGNDLSGGIPPELGDLSNLRWLHLFDNQLTGSIPSRLGDLTNLQNLWLFNNQLTGSIPSQLGNLNNLLILALQYNQLSGSIPPELGDLSNLQELWLCANQLSGSVPSQLGSLTNLTTFHLHDNQLEGEIPTTITNLTGLTDTHIDHNMLAASNPTVKVFLDTKNPGWDLTQTVPPIGVQVTNATQTSITLTWTPILYTGDGGYYEVDCGTVSGGPYDSVGCITGDKTAGGCTVDGLARGTTYYFVVRTFTPAHDAQQNDLLSTYSVQVAGTTSPNNAPVAQDDEYYVGSTQLAVSDSAGVLHNDLDADGDPLTATLCTDVAVGTLAFNADGSFGYTPALDYSDSVTFTYQAHDGIADSDLATVSLAVDTLPPQLLAVDPIAGSPDVPIDAPLVVTFNEAISTSTLAYTALPDPGGWSPVWSSGNTVVTLSHPDLNYLTTYTLTVTASDDVAGNSLSNTPHIWCFTTAPKARIYLPLVKCLWLSSR